MENNKKIEGIKFLRTIEDLSTIMGGNKPAVGETDLNPQGCWCTCHCMEATVSGFQLGMISPQGSGDISKPSCSSILGSIWGY